MELTGNQKLLILAVLIAVVLYLIYTQKSGKSVNKQEHYADDVSVESFDESVCLDSVSSELTGSDDTSNNTSCGSDDSSDKINIDQDPELSKSSVKKLLDKKMKNANSSPDGTYKRVSYACNTRDQKSSSNLDEDFFGTGNPFNASGNSDFYGNDEGSNLAAYAGCGSKKLTEEEKFNSSALLPKEQNNDWFDTCADVTKGLKIKNRHLLNTNRPMGVNTVLTTNKNPSYDLRSNPVNPKIVISPWLQSSIEPTANVAGNCI